MCLFDEEVITFWLKQTSSHENTTILNTLRIVPYFLYTEMYMIVSIAVLALLPPHVRAHKRKLS